MTPHGCRFFDAYANWNGCNYVVEVKQMQMWNQSCTQGVSIFASNARAIGFPIYMTLVLYIRDNTYSKEQVAQQIHEVEPSINIVFASIESDVISYSMSHLYLVSFFFHITATLCN